MRSGLKRNWAGFAVGGLLGAWVLGCGGSTTEGLESLEQGTAPPPSVSVDLSSVDLRTRLESIAGLTVLTDVEVNGFRFFTMDYEQPVDHLRPWGTRFQQRVTLMHRSETAPMVLDTEGTALFEEPIPAEPTDLLQGNQLTVEHRFYGASKPADMDWRKLTMWQAAADAHRLVEAFKPLYGGRWLSTGVFKGGTAALAHRFYFPNDVHATVTYSAQHNRGLHDARHGRFILTKVGDAACRQQLASLQYAALTRRDELLPFMDGYDAQGFTFNTLGKDRAFEFAVIEVPFIFWQYYGMAGTCEGLPSPEASAEELFAFFSYVSTLEFTFSDQALEESAPLYYQGATQLGGPGYPEVHLRPLMRYAGEHIPTRFPPTGVRKQYEPWTVGLLEAWTRFEAKRVLLVYGDLSPWSASAFSTTTGNDAYRVIADDSIGFFGTLSALPEPQRSFLLGRLSEWADAPVQLPTGMDALRRRESSDARMKAYRAR
ncbi:S28 family serine protease [Myxococcus sp. AB036A]|uniref:S28 family serine protease n=1 Tax=Myxococcus sp. AB036A TaxID=2562793 RepID=UPI00114680FA|nr:S28 family serine protease [Myxococcus sp. AB036A]